MVKSFLFNEDQIEFIRRAYKKYTLKELTVVFNDHYGTDFKKNQFENFVYTHKIQSGRTGRFKKGEKPWNTGTKGMTTGGSTSFKKGLIPHNHLPVGSERFNKEGHLEIKIGEPSNWKTCHRIIWERYNGKVPPKHVVRFADGDPTNWGDIDNLVLVSHAENLILNRLQFSEMPEDLKESTLLIAKIIAKTHALGKV